MNEEKVNLQIGGTNIQVISQIIKTDEPFMIKALDSAPLKKKGALSSRPTCR